MATMESMPLDIKLLILDQIHDLKDLYHLELASTSFAAIIQNYSERIYLRFLRDDLNKESFKLAVFLYNIQYATERGNQPSALSANTGFDLLKDDKQLVRIVFEGGYIGKRKAHEGLEKRRCIQSLLDNQRVVQYWVNDTFCNKNLRGRHGHNSDHPPNIKPKGPVKPSETEKQRVTSTMYRIWCFFIICGHVQLKETPEERGNLYMLLSTITDGNFYKYQCMCTVFDRLHDSLRQHVRTTMSSYIEREEVPDDIPDNLNNLGLQQHLQERRQPERRSWTIAAIMDAIFETFGLIELGDFHTSGSRYQHLMLQPVQQWIDRDIRYNKRLKRWCTKAKFPFDFEKFFQQYRYILIDSIVPTPGPPRPRQIYFATGVLYEPDDVSSLIHDSIACLDSLIFDDERLASWGYEKALNANADQFAKTVKVGDEGEEWA